MAFYRQKAKFSSQGAVRGAEWALMLLDIFHKNTESDGYKPDLDSQYSFVPKTTDVDWGTINADAAASSGLLSIPLRLAHGEHRGPTNGYGIRHILLGHGEELAEEDWYSVQDFVLCTIDQFDAICKDATPNRWHLVRRAPSSKEKHWILVIEEDRSKLFYRIITGWTRDGYRRLKNTPIWELRECSSGSGEPSLP